MQLIGESILQHTAKYNFSNPDGTFRFSATQMQTLLQYSPQLKFVAPIWEKEKNILPRLNIVGQWGRNE